MDESRRGFVGKTGLTVGGLLAMTTASAFGQAGQKRQGAEGSGASRLRRPISETLPEGEVTTLPPAVLRLTRLDMISLATDKPSEAALKLSVKELRQANEFFAKKAAALAQGPAEAGDACCCCCPCCCMVSASKPLRAG